MIEQLYRSSVKPDPIWAETALYCGYTHIDLGAGVWLSRDMEYLVRQSLTDQRCAKEIFEKIRNSGKLFYPSVYQVSNYCKIARLLRKFKVFSVVGKSRPLEELLQSVDLKTIYSDVDYKLPHVVRMQPEDIARSTTHVVTLIDSTYTHLKDYIVNWGNVVVYSNFMFYDYDGREASLEGGNNEPKLETAAEKTAIKI